MYRQFTVDTMLELARHLNTSWDGPLADRLRVLAEIADALDLALKQSA